MKYKKFIKLIRLAVVLFAIGALTLNGANAAQRLFSAYSEESDSSQDIVTNAWLLPGPPAPDEGPNNMDRSSKPYCEQPAYLAAPLLFNVDNNGNRNKIIGEPNFISADFSFHSENKFSLKTTSSLVSSALGIQFTLVGAKPSGTS
ncbi:MAG: hypothetical protein GXO93_06950 [FCB group bacterium]|nr:hypothetical protein [FCB group bacterium]